MKLCIILSFIFLIGGCNMKKEKTGNLPNFDKLWDFNNPKETELKFKEIIPKAKYDKVYYGELLTQIARAQGLQGHFSEAHATLDQVEKMLKKLDSKKVRIRYNLERGRVYNSSRNKEDAKKYFLVALKTAQDSGEELFALDAIHMLGIVEPPEKQLEWNLKAIQIAEKSENKQAKSWLGPLYNNIGWSYHDQGKYSKAMEYFTKSLHWRQKIKDAQGTRVAKWTIGRCYRSMKKYDEALEIQKALADEFETNNITPDGYVYEELGELYLVLNDKDKSQKCFKKAYDLLSQDTWLVKNQSDRLARIKKLSK